MIVIPKSNGSNASNGSIFIKRAKFYEAKKLQDETVTEYYNKLLNLSINCEFSEQFNDRVLCDKFITGFRHGFIFDQLCSQHKHITISDALNLALKYESDFQNSSRNLIIDKSDGFEVEVSLYLFGVH